MDNTFLNEPKVEILLANPEGGENRPWEGGLNGRFYRIKRGQKVSVPKSIALLIEENEHAALQSRLLLEAYRREQGKKLC